MNIHTTGHSLLFKYVGICPANGFCRSHCVCMWRGLSEIEDISPSGNWLQHHSARTSRWHKGFTQQSKLGGRKFEGVSSKSVSEPQSKTKNISCRSFSLHLFTRLDTLRSPLAACAKIVAMEITIHQGNFNIFPTCSGEETAIKALLQI